MRVVAVLAVALGFLAGCASDAPSTTVPLLVGLKESVATQAAEDADLEPEIEYGPDEDLRDGFVYAQSMREGTTTDEGDTITLSVSTGPR